MIATLSLFDILILLGISQGIFSGALLATRRPILTNNLVLAMVQITFVLLSFKILLHTLSLWNVPWLRYFPLAIDLTIQPLLFLYVRTATDQSFRLKRSAWLHFIPFAIFFVHALAVYISTGATNDLHAKDAIADLWYYNDVKRVEDLLSVASAWIYLVLCHRQLSIYQHWYDNHTSDMSLPTFAWLRNVIWLFGAIALVLTVNLAVDLLSIGYDGFFYHWELFYLIIAAAVYYVGVAGYRQQQPPKIHIEKRVIAAGKIIYDDNTVKTAKEKLQAAMMEKKLYRDPEINLASLAAATDLPQNLVSYTINKVYGQNFRSFTNGFRIEEVKIRLIDPASSHLSILGIALESGFNSEASFYRVFRNATGKSPKEFLDDAKNTEKNSQKAF